MKNSWIKIVIMSLMFVHNNALAGVDRLSLAGRWSVALDSMDVGTAAQWYQKHFTDSITLPGTLCDGGYGKPCTLQPAMTKEVFQNLKRTFDYVGAAWYSRQITIPKHWKGKRIFLRLERVLWTSDVWVNGQKVGNTGESLSTPHCYELTGSLKAGKVNTICIRIDNRKRYDMSVRDMAHAYTNETQTLWNGILGDLSLTAKTDVFIDRLTLTPDIDAGKVRVKIALSNTKPISNKSRITLTIQSPNGNYLPKQSMKVEGTSLETELAVPAAQLWDEFSPKVYRLTAELTTPQGTDVCVSSFGMRKLSTNDALLHINGRRMFLRGTLESCVFPLTGYPPTDESGWQKVFQRARLFGLNHLRFHSWCPPEAAFALADKMGLYLQIELPVWTLNLGANKPTADFLKQEAFSIIAAYGNHPSFCFLSMGNELEGDFDWLHRLVNDLRSIDQRHLYTTTTYTFQKGHGGWPETTDDFFITQKTDKGWVRGQGVFEDEAPSFKANYSVSIEHLPVPIVSHEIGQYSVYPDLRSIHKFTGNLKPLNLVSVADDLRRKGRLNRADNYTAASGKFAALLYKEEIERALRTPHFSGFQLLGLSDYPGQSTALVGLVDVFWDDKGILSPAQFRSFCSEVVPLALFDKATYTNNETFTAQLRVANFSRSELENTVAEWSLTNQQGAIIAAGKLKPATITVGNETEIGRLSVPLSSIQSACQLTLRVALSGTQNGTTDKKEYANAWKIWIYPQSTPSTSTTALYTRDFNEAAAALAAGKSVLFNPELSDIKGVKGRFLPVFWSPVHFPDQPGTMGILCQPNHPALADFPTEEHSDWQWRDICVNAVTMNLDSISATTEPIVGMIDNFFANRNLALVFEAKVGTGRLIVCSADLDDSNKPRPEAHQLKYSLLKYMETEAFAPTLCLEIDQIEGLLKMREKRTLR